ncbi:MAG: IS4 family transposase [Planctomycetaceae bacterium]
MAERIADELAGVDLGDERLNRRSCKVLESLAANPQASINGAVSGWADTQAAYRFFSNPRVTPEQILQPHRVATMQRMQAQSVVLVVQDTTELDYTDHPMDDARCLNAEDRYGVYQHVQLAVTPSRLPLGVVGTHSFDRDPQTLGQDPPTKRAQKKLPIEQKESARWLEGYRQACMMAAECPTTHVISVADREADIYDIFLEAQTQGQAGKQVDYLIRAHENRSTPEVNREVSRRTYIKVRDTIERSPVLAVQTQELSATPRRAARQAKLEIRALRTEVKPPNHRPGLAVITHHVILVQEVDGPHDGTDVCWLLVTTLPIETVEQITTAVDYYAARWTIETYFRVLKTGCRVEEIQLETKTRMLNCVTMYQIIAWRILYLTYLNRTSPQLPCTTVFIDQEWQPTWQVVHKTKPPATPPTLNEFTTILAHLGGYNNRATEPAAGPQPLWTGLRRMLDFSLAWITFQEAHELVCK